MARGWGRMVFLAIDIIAIAYLFGCARRNFIVFIVSQALGLAAYAFVLGPITVGRHCFIGANVVLARDKFAGEFRSLAERQIRRDLVIETIADKETLAATEKDLDDRIAEQAEKRGVNPGQLYAQLEKSGRLKEMERSITEDKVFKWLLERNDVSTNA